MESKPAAEELPEFDSGEEPPKKRSRRRMILIGLGIVLLFCCGITAIIGEFGNPPDREEEEAVAEVTSVSVIPTNTPAPTNTPEATETPLPPTEIPEPTATAPPTATLEPIQALHNALADAIGGSNRDADPRLEVTDFDGTVEVIWTINDNLTDGMIKGGARLDIRNMLEVMAGTDYPYSNIIFRGTFPLVDNFGNSSEETVVTAEYSRETVERINFSNFLTDNVYTIADDVFIHAAFQD